MDGITSGWKRARIVCRMKSVDVPRVITKRCALAPRWRPPTCAGTGGPAHEQHNRRVQRLECSDTAGPVALRRVPPLVAEHLRGELLEALEADRQLVPPDDLQLGSPCELVRALRGNAGCNQSPGHQRFRVGQPSRLPERQRIAVPMLARRHPPMAYERGEGTGESTSPPSPSYWKPNQAGGSMVFPPNEAEGERRSCVAGAGPEPVSLVELRRDDVVCREHDSPATRKGVLGDDVDRGAFEASMRYVSASTRARSSASATRLPRLRET